MAEYIDREAANLALAEQGFDWDKVKQALASVPTADVAPVMHGRWERDEDGDWYCTNCYEVVAICESGRERTYRKPYCPNCGARMDEGAE